MTEVEAFDINLQMLKVNMRNFSIRIISTLQF